MQTSSRKIGILAVLGSALCFGTTGTTQQLGVPNISPLAVGAARLLCGSLFLFLFAYSQRSSRGTIRMPKADLFICGLGVAMYQLTFFSAVHITGIAISTVTALGSVPTFSAIVAYVILGEKPQRSWYLGTSVTILGIVLVGTANGVDEFNPLGIALAAVAGFGFAVFSVVSRKSLSRGAQDIWLTASSFGVAAALTAPFLFAQNPVWMTTTEGALSVLWLGLVPTAIGYFLFTYGLKRIDSSTAATVVLAEPATATILAAVIIGEVLVFQSFIGIAIVAIGILYISRAKVVES
jgi:DME family drug/metabolite transporter